MAWAPTRHEVIEIFTDPVTRQQITNQLNEALKYFVGAQINQSTKYAILAFTNDRLQSSFGHHVRATDVHFERGTLTSIDFRFTPTASEINMEFYIR